MLTVYTFSLFGYIHCVSKYDTDVAHYNFNAYSPILAFFAEMLLSEYAIKW